MRRKTKGLKAIVVAHSWRIRNNYDELIESLSRRPRAESALAIAEAKQAKRPTN